MKSVVVFGAGAWGINHVKTLYQMGRLAAVVEPDSERAAALATLLPGVEIIADPAAVWTRHELNHVVIATPAPTHLDITLTSLAANKHVLVEKPMALSAAEAVQMVQAGVSSGTTLMVGHLLLYKPAVRFLKEYLSEGQLGRVFSLHQERCKLGRARPVENALWSLGVHDVALLLHLVGDAPTKVIAAGHCGLQPTVGDDVYVHLSFPSGVAAHLHSSWLWPEDRRRLVIVGEKGMLIYDEKDESIVLHKKTIDSALRNCDAGTENIFKAEPGYQPLKAELEHFINCSETGTSPLTDAASGLQVLKVLDQAVI